MGKLSNEIRHILPRAWETARVKLGSRIVVATWPNVGDVGKNWGDKLNPYLINLLSRRTVLHQSQVIRRHVPEIYAVIGSSLGLLTRKNIRVWGNGFIDSNEFLQIHPDNVIAVRGPKSLLKLRSESNVGDLPIGDPALLMPLLYRSARRPTYQIGVIPHFRDQDLALFRQLRNGYKLRVINILDGIESVCDQINECETIVSSSLHGAVAAHAYGIPATLISASNLPLGDGFKFLDYLSSVGIDESEVRECPDVGGIFAAADAARLPKFYPDLEKLLMSCPFIDLDVRANLIAKINDSYPRELL